jgi:hypothetical protein
LRVDRIRRRTQHQGQSRQRHGKRKCDLHERIIRGSAHDKGSWRSAWGGAPSKRPPTP